MAQKKFRYKLAVGLDYDPLKSETPSVGVKGEELQADQVVKLAKRFGVSVVEQPELAKALNVLELDQEIPENLFEAVAIVLNQLEKRGK